MAEQRSRRFNCFAAYRPAQIARPGSWAAIALLPRNDRVSC